MDITDKLKNPITISIICGILVFIYLWYSLPDDIDDKKDKTNKPSYIRKLKNINLLIPIISAIIVWFVASCYLSTNVNNSNQELSKNENTNLSGNFQSQQFLNPKLNTSSQVPFNNSQPPLFQTFGSKNIQQPNIQPNVDPMGNAIRSKYISSDGNLNYNLVNKKNTTNNLQNKNIKFNKVELPDLFLEVDGFPQF